MTSPGCWCAASSRAPGAGASTWRAGSRPRAISPTTVAGLIDIASQHDQQSLTDAESQMAILDAFAENERLRADMAAAHRDAGRDHGGAGVVQGRRAHARRARGPAQVPARRARGGGAAAGRGRAAARRARAPQGRGEVLRRGLARRGGALRAGGRGRRADRRGVARAGAAGGARPDAGVGAGAARGRAGDGRGRGARSRPVRVARAVGSRRGSPRSRSGCSCSAAVPQARRARWPR